MDGWKSDLRRKQRYTDGEELRNKDTHTETEKVESYFWLLT